MVRLSTPATLLPEKKLWFSLSRRLGGCWSCSGYFGEEIVLLLLPRFEPPDLPAYILVIVLTVLPHTDLKIIEKSILIKRDGRFGLGVFD